MLDFSKNWFELFGLPVGYIVDSGELSARYRDLQRLVHPDRFASAPDAEKRAAMQGATLINEAYQGLKDPLRRAKYLLSLHGIDLEAHPETTHDAAFLMEQLELREELAEAKDRPDPQAVIHRIKNGLGRQMNTLMGQMAVQFEAATADQIEGARENVRKMQFLHKLRHDAEALEAELDEQIG